MSIRETETVILRAIREVGQGHVAQAMDLSPSRMSDLMKDDFPNRIAKLLVACGLRIVPVSEPTYPPGHVAAMETLARLYMQQQAAARMPGVTA